MNRGVPGMSKVQIFASFDIDHDQQLYEQLLTQSRTTGSGFELVGGSERATGADVGNEEVRRRIRDVDQVIVICGEHTGESTHVSAEIRIAQEEKKPYFLLWGRREIMCTKPVGAKPLEGMYSWTRQILQDQIVRTFRNAEADAKAEIAGAPRGSSHRGSGFG